MMEYVITLAAASSATFLVIVVGHRLGRLIDQNTHRENCERREIELEQIRVGQEIDALGETDRNRELLRWNRKRLP
jgi:hypothetical protein